MRPLNVPVRLAVAVLTAVAATGCVSVGDDGSGGGARPSRSAGERGAGVPGGTDVVSGGEAGYGVAEAGRGHRRPAGGTAAEEARPEDDGADGGRAERPEGAEGEAKGTGVPSAPAPPRATGSAPPGEGPPEPVPSRTTPPEPPWTEEPEPEPTQEPPPSPEPEPTVAEPSSSAHEPPGTQLAQREPAPEAGVPVPGYGARGWA
ncbi:MULTISPECIES: hypothetical protein [unclassified Streptomyces]|uniref:hypothetical protein n=1 Tax=unclassified Streptomyces TaxID=2593676 RepID=UPI002237AF54|nr:hypothetical protein [Streptomyces sp. SHP 1-2]MCW5250174.1 hypothetical protein [Streptomyces sp. SHP 1-2]